MRSRRTFVKMVGLLAGGLCLPGTAKSLEPRVYESTWTLPDESEPHQRTWMAFGASRKIWGNKLLPEVQRNLAVIANTIARFEPVSMLVRREDLGVARRLVNRGVELVEWPIDDLWMRDTGPVFVVTEGGKKASIGFNFNGWGEKQEYGRDAKVAQYVSKRAAVGYARSELTLEGGGIEVDGKGTAIITESCVLNENRNPGLSKADCEAELRKLLGIQKVIWLQGIKNRDITDGHTDFYARFVSPGVVVAGYDPDPKSFDHQVTKQHIEVLSSATDAMGRRLKVVIVDGPNSIRERYSGTDFAAGYINFYVCNGAVLLPEFGDKKADAAAKEKLGGLFPDREILQLNIDGIAAGGGGIHCTTQQEPKVE